MFTALVIFGVGVNGDEGNYKTLVMDGGLYSDTSFWAFLLTPICSAAATLLANIPFFLNGYEFAYAEAAEAKSAEAKPVEANPAGADVKVDVDGTTALQLVARGLGAVVQP